MRASDIAKRLTGISFPVIGGGLSWTPTETETATAQRVIAFLEDRRVLYRPSEMEMPDHCVASLLEIRHFLTSELGHLDPNGALGQNLRGMRAACRKFLDNIEGIRQGHSYVSVRSLGPYGEWVFSSALGELRGVVGIHLAQIAARNDLGIEDQLATILPASDFETGTH